MSQAVQLYLVRNYKLNNKKGLKSHRYCPWNMAVDLQGSII